MSEPNDRFEFADYEGLLPDAGDFLDLGDYALTYVIDTDGSRWPVLMETFTDPDDLNGTVFIGDAVATNMAPHERCGALPAAYQQALWGVIRCGGWKRDGQRCRNIVTETGGRCDWHNDAVIIRKGYVPQRLNVLLAITKIVGEDDKASVREEFLTLSDHWHRVDPDACEAFWERNRKRIRT
jgi:hypothetical protein